MEECELCGNKMQDVYVINLDGTELRVCTRCAAGKNVVRSNTRETQARVMSRQRKAREEPALKDDYNNIIREAREQMKLPIRVLAEMISETETLLLRIEQGKAKPDAKLAKKLEKALGIKLEETQSEPEKDAATRRSDKATLGEFISRE